MAPTTPPPPQRRFGSRETAVTTTAGVGMLTAALILGVLGGAFGMAIGLLGYGTAVDVAGADAAVALRVVSIAIPAAGLLGGAFAREKSIIGGTLMLLSAGSMGLCFGYDRFTAVPMVLSGLGAVSAFVGADAASGARARPVVLGVGIFVLAIAVVVLICDLVLSVVDQALHVTKVGAVWSAIHRTSLLLLQPAIERHIEPRIGQWLWDPVVLNVLTAPMWLLLGSLGAVLFLLGRNTRPRVGDAPD